MTELKQQTRHHEVASEKAGRSASEAHAIRTFLPELIELERLLADAPDGVSSRVVARIPVRDLSLPLYRVDLGSSQPDAPVVVMVGGVHGLERIGAQVVIAWLGSLAARLRWDESLRALLDRVRIVTLPIANPGGMYLNQRANPAGVDLMRNAPILAQGESTPMLGGQRLSRRLPWYIGTPDQGMELENQALQAVIDELLPASPFSVALDCHSGFGWQDQIWFPYAYRRRPMRRIDSVMALKLLWEQAYPNHNYVFEPQSTHYLTHGDLWDYFYKRVNKRATGTFIPLTLEMGSWRWLKKRPRQLFRLDGFFNPLVPHRHQRVLRSHLLLMDFLVQAAVSHGNWLPTGDQTRLLREAAIMHWYRDHH